MPQRIIDNIGSNLLYNLSQTIIFYIADMSSHTYMYRYIKYVNWVFRHRSILDEQLAYFTGLGATNSILG